MRIAKQTQKSKTGFTKQITEVYEIKWIVPNFSKYSAAWRRVRAAIGDQKFSQCIKCDRIFNDDEMMGLAAFENRTNSLICQDCISVLGYDDLDPHLFTAVNGD